MGKSLFFQEPTQAELDNKVHKLASARTGKHTVIGANKWILEKNRRLGHTYLGSNQYHQDVSCTVAVNRLKLNHRWGDLSSDELNSLHKEMDNIRMEKQSSKSGHLVNEEFRNLGDDADIFSMEGGNNAT